MVDLLLGASATSRIKSSRALPESDRDNQTGAVLNACSSMPDTHTHTDRADTTTKLYACTTKRTGLDGTAGGVQE